MSQLRSFLISFWLGFPLLSFSANTLALLDLKLHLSTINLIMVWYFTFYFPPTIGWLTAMCQPEVVEGTQGEISCELPVIYIDNWYFTWNLPPINFACFQLIFVGGKFHVKYHVYWHFTWIFHHIYMIYSVA